MRWIIILATHLVAFGLMPLALASPLSAPVASPMIGTEQKRILVLYSFNNNVPTLQQTVAGINGAIRKHNLRSADFGHEYREIAPHQ